MFQVCVACLCCHAVAVSDVPAAAFGLADGVRWTGVAVAVAGAFEAAPAGTARVWRRILGAARPARAWLARYIPLFRSKAVNIEGATVHGSMRVKPLRIQGQASAWNPGAPVEQRLETLYRMHLNLVTQVGDVREQGRQETERLRQDLAAAIEELRTATSDITVRIRDAEDSNARADARGIWVVGAGIVLTGVPDGLATYGLTGWAAIIGAVAIAVYVGGLVVKDQRSRGDRSAGR